MAEIDRYLNAMLSKEGSDLHFVAAEPPRIRVHGDLETIDNEPMPAETAAKVIEEIMPATARHQLEDRDQADFAYSIDGVSRFRCNVFRHIGGLGAIIRAIPSEALTLVDLKMPDAIGTLCLQKQGLILVTGKTGSGKSTTLAAIVDNINRRRHGHILTIEDPIEFTHQRHNCLISQREVGRHTPSFAAALHSALREDPDVILVGEMRDLETISIAVTAAETGILVMGTLHTNGAAAAVDRIVNSFPADKQSHIRSMLSTSLRGVISQQLCKRTGRPGRIAALEILINNSAIANLIRQGKLDQLENAMQSGALQGMQTMDGALRKLMDGRLITPDEAYEKAFNKASFRKSKSGAA